MRMLGSSRPPNGLLEPIGLPQDAVKHCPHNRTVTPWLLRRSGMQAGPNNPRFFLFAPWFLEHELRGAPDGGVATNRQTQDLLWLRQRLATPVQEFTDGEPSALVSMVTDDTHERPLLRGQLQSNDLAHRPIVGLPNKPGDTLRFGRWRK